MVPKIKTKNICGECKFYLVRSVCPKAEYKKRDLNLAACAPSDKACELFQPKYKKKKSEEPDMGETLELLNKHIYKCPTDTKELLVFQDGIYVNAESLIHQILESEYGEDLKKRFVEEAYAHLQRANYVERKEINKFTNIIPIKNGFFNLLTRECFPFNPEQIYTYKMNAEYDLDAKCPNFLMNLKKIIPDEEDRNLLQEIMGYSLVLDMPFHKIFWWFGTGRNGKSVIARTLAHILNPENVSCLNLSEFSEGRRFSLQRLYGKLLNISSEPKLSKYGLQTNVLKMVTGQDIIHAELKGRNKTLDFTNFAKCVVLGNRFPKVEDNSLGWWDRVVVLKFPNSFEGKECIQNIENNWLPKETNGIFLWMLDGLYRLRENRFFSSSKSTEETKAEFMKVSDPFNAWIIDNCVILPNAYLTREEALTDCQNYCDDIGQERVPKRVFYERLRNTPKIRDKQKKIKGKNEHVFEGIALRSEENNLEEQTTLKNNIKGSKVAEVASSHTRLFTGNHEKVGVCKSATIATSATINNNSFLIHCFDCGKTLEKNEVYSHHGNGYCKDCRLQFLDLEKKGVETK